MNLFVGNCVLLWPCNRNQDKLYIQIPSETKKKREKKKEKKNETAGWLDG